MVTKKYLLLTGLCALLASTSLTAQESGSESGSSYSSRDMVYRGESYDVLDSSVIPDRRMEQHRKFMNHQYNFPARPRNMWEVGVGGGLYNISGDVPSLMLWRNGGYGISAHVRKALGYLFSARMEYDYGRGVGQQWQPSQNYRLNQAWANNGYQFALPDGTVGAPPVDNIFYNYSMESHQLNLDLIVSSNNIKFHKAQTGVSVYGFAGIGGIAYQTWVNALDANGNGYQTVFNDVLAKYQDASGQIPLDRHVEVQKELRDRMDDTYETRADENRVYRRPSIFGTKTLNFVGTFGVGVQFKVSKRFNIGIEDRVTTMVGTDDDVLDGQKWDEQVRGQPVRTQNKDGINFASIKLNFNIGGKNSVEPLYWLNPLDFAYSELSNPRHMILPEPILSDSDGDGIADQFDKCPGTPAGVAVDSHGCPIDTDGDGVPDDRDKQLITPTECQPVDADGVGECPCHCEGVVATCANIGAGVVTYSGTNSRITDAMKGQLANLAAQMSANPTCRVVLIGQGNESKLQQQRSWDRVNALQEYMSNTHNIDRNRFIFQYGQPGDANSVMYRAATQGEEGNSTVPPPHPQLSNQR